MSFLQQDMYFLVLAVHHMSIYGNTLSCRMVCHFLNRYPDMHYHVIPVSRHLRHTILRSAVVSTNGNTFSKPNTECPVFDFCSHCMAFICGCWSTQKAKQTHQAVGCLNTLKSTVHCTLINGTLGV